MKKRGMLIYKCIRDGIHSGDLVEWRTHSFLGWLIRLRTGSPVNHSSLVVRFNIDGCANRRYIMEANPRGVELHLLSKRLEKHNGHAWLYRLKDVDGDKRECCLGYALKALDAPYDYNSLFKQIIVKVSTESSRYFCSELVQHAWEDCGIIKKRPYALQPGDFERLGVTRDPVSLI